MLGWAGGTLPQWDWTVALMIKRCRGAWLEVVHGLGEGVVVALQRRQGPQPHSSGHHNSHIFRDPYPSSRAQGFFLANMVGLEPTSKMNNLMNVRVHGRLGPHSRSSLIQLRSLPRTLRAPRMEDPTLGRLTGLQIQVGFGTPTEPWIRLGCRGPTKLKLCFRFRTTGAFRVRRWPFVRIPHQIAQLGFGAVKAVTP